MPTRPLDKTPGPARLGRDLRSSDLG